MPEVQFLFDNQLIAEVEALIKKAKNQLLLISPFIDLDRRIQDALRQKKDKHEFKLMVLFGKNEDNIYKSIKKGSIEFLKEFPNVEIRYNESLHAKFYMNDFNYIMTSLNLYDYSLAKNIEVGIIAKHSSKGFIGKVFDGTNILINKGLERVSQDILGQEEEVDPILKFRDIYNNSERMFQSEAVIVEKGGVAGYMTTKVLSGTKVLIDKLTQPEKKILSTNNNNEEDKVTIGFQIAAKTHSASTLAKQLGITTLDITKKMEAAGYIIGDSITELGKSKGLVVKNYMGNNYIAYPQNLII